MKSTCTQEELVLKIPKEVDYSKGIYKHTPIMQRVTETLSKCEERKRLGSCGCDNCNYKKYCQKVYDKFCVSQMREEDYKKWYNQWAHRVRMKGNR